MNAAFAGSLFGNFASSKLIQWLTQTGIPIPQSANQAGEEREREQVSGHTLQISLNESILINQEQS